MDRAILDTNVFVAAAFRPNSASGHILEAVRAGRLLLLWNDQTRRETRSILGHIPRVGWERFSDLFRDEGQVTGPTAPSRFADAVADPDDRKFAALASLTGVPLVSSDSHLLAAHGVAGITVLTPSAFARRYLQAL